ncbi:MAG: 6,7-dimethyl-8-ribityllumazine synthase [Planctomycetota bacterium]|nr:MAG: 6,7-dimethyl-8-ribityllumazine synthase [Planctomycetota bacterium]
MPRSFHGMLDGAGKRFAIVVSRFNELVTGKLLSGALDCLDRHAVNDDDITVAWVPGAMELVVVAKKLAMKGQFDGVICLGAVIRGATPHFEYVSAQVARGIAKIAEDSGVPCSFGVLTCDTLDQALERSGAKAGNKGVEAAMATLETVQLLSTLDRELS